MESSNVNYEYIKNFNTDGSETLIDVREPSELQETGIIPHSINIPLATLEQSIQNLSSEEFQEKFGKKKPEKESTVIVSCKMGGRSARAQALLRGLGYTNVKNYSGGWLDWEKHLD